MLKKVYNHLRIKGKPMTVHTEMIYDDEVWKIIQEKVKNKNIHTWYVVTPVNSDIFYSHFRIPLSFKEYESRLIKRYKWLIQKKQNVQLHVHLSKDLRYFPFWAQELLIKKAIDWFEQNLGQCVDEIVLGWWCYNEETERILETLGIRLIKRFEYNDCHDYDWINLI